MNAELAYGRVAFTSVQNIKCSIRGSFEHERQSHGANLIRAVA